MQRLPAGAFPADTVGFRLFVFDPAECRNAVQVRTGHFSAVDTIPAGTQNINKGQVLSNLGSPSAVGRLRWTADGGPRKEVNMTNITQILLLVVPHLILALPLMFMTAVISMAVFRLVLILALCGDEEEERRAVMRALGADGRR